MREKERCTYCGTLLEEEDLQVFDGVVMCNNCFNERTVECENCGTRIWADDAEGNENHVLCAQCFEENYTNCNVCGRLIHNDNAYYESDDDDYPYCHNCFHDMQNRPIKNYNFKPAPVFYGTGNLFYGVELEIDKGGEDSDNAQKLLDIANVNEERIYCKHDGSICDGFEIVSHPMSMEYHANSMNWKAVFEKAVATYQGFLPDDVDELINAGFTLDEIEEYIYCSCGGGEI